ncbi:MAG: tRNA (adenosine(37)-N6)-dimethylallyltransferase MiaA [Patescibacteria group bacterium]
MPSSPIIAIVGPTASGKSALAVRLAKKFGGEIISADSRQVYRGLDIGSGKVLRDKLSKRYKLEPRSYLHQGIPHHLLDVASPRRQFSVAQYQKLGSRVIEQIIKRGKLPIVCGGTGFYVEALLKNYTLPPVPPNLKLRAKLEKLPTEKLGEKLEILDPERFQNIDVKNRPRLIRAIEIAAALGEVPPLETKARPWHWLTIGIKVDPEKLRQKIKARLTTRLRAGLINEVKNLHRNGLSWKRLESFGLEYAHIARFAQHSVSHRLPSDLIDKLETDIWHYAKRQMTWWRRDPTIHWIKNYREATQLTRDFLKK